MNNGKNKNLVKSMKPTILDRSWIPNETIKKCKKERRCWKCGRMGHMIQNYQSSTYRATPPPGDQQKSNNQAKANNQPPFEKQCTGKLRLITQVARIVEEVLENE